MIIVSANVDIAFRVRPVCLPSKGRTRGFAPTLMAKTMIKAFHGYHQTHNSRFRFFPDSLETLCSRFGIIKNPENTVQPRQFKNTANLFLQCGHFNIAIHPIHNPKR